MWHSKPFKLPSVLIVENKEGNIFIVENKRSKPIVDKILKNDIIKTKIAKSKSRSKPAEVIQPKSLDSPIINKTDIKQEPEDFESVPFIDPSFEFHYKEDLEVKEEVFITPANGIFKHDCGDEHIEPTFDGRWSSDDELNDSVSEKISLKSSKGITQKEEFPKHKKFSNNMSTRSENLCELRELEVHVEKSQLKNKETTFDGKWSSDDDVDDGFPNSDDEPLINIKRQKRRERKAERRHRKKNPDAPGPRDNFWSHKKQNLVGKMACKYCETLFGSKQEQKLHECKYLKCNPRNFICRVCGKELSRKTFSNHLHETMNCQFCGKKFVNPRSMKTHMQKQHKDKVIVPPKTLKDVIKETDAAEIKKTAEAKLLADRIRFECDICGKYLRTLQSMSCHMTLHTGKTSYICETCGADFATSKGIQKHSCANNRKRPLKDYSSYNYRHCLYCELDFASYDENKAHPCKYRNPDDPLSAFCRCCGKSILKREFRRHIIRHEKAYSDEWTCKLCNKRLSSQRCFQDHMLVHSGAKPHKCPRCPESFVKKEYLARHMRFHGNTVTGYRCEICFKELSAAAYLRDHIRRVHSKIAQCEICKSEVSRQHLKDHLLNFHKPLPCSLCNKSFAVPRLLRRHEKTHISDSLSRQSCDFCFKELNPKNLKAHVFKKHPTEFKSWQASL